MALRVWSSKFRHTFGTPAKRDLCYEGVKISRNAHDGNFCAVNPKYLAVVTDSAGGGTFTIIPLDKVCKHNHPPCQGIIMIILLDKVRKHDHLS